MCPTMLPSPAMASKTVCRACRSLITSPCVQCTDCGKHAHVACWKINRGCPETGCRSAPAPIQLYSNRGRLNGESVRRPQLTACDPPPPDVLLLCLREPLAWTAVGVVVGGALVAKT